MTCQHCCGANLLFDNKTAADEKRKYLKKGARGATRKLIRSISGYDYRQKSLLDIGGGIGAIQIYFLENGGAYSLDVDASQAYLTTAAEIAEEKGFLSKSEYMFGDLTDLESELKPVEFVTLDKVVCCYPDYVSLLKVATSNCRQVIALTMPISNFFGKIAGAFLNLYMIIIKNPYRTYVHSRKEVESYIETQGFKRVQKRLSFPWHVMVFERKLQ